jgi:hypothetical protein
MCFVLFSGTEKEASSTPHDKGFARWFVAGAPFLVVSDGYRLCSLDVFASFQGKRRSRRRHSGLKTLEASRLQVSFCRCVMGRTCVRFLFV